MLIETSKYLSKKECGKEKVKFNRNTYLCLLAVTTISILSFWSLIYVFRIDDSPL